LSLSGASQQPLGWAALLSTALLSAALLVCCKSDTERAHQGQVARLVEHIDRLRRADNVQKREPLEALTRVPCPDAEACALQDLCLRAYRLHQSSLDAIAELERQASSAAAPPPSVGERLQRAERDLTQAKALSEQCAETQVRVMRKALLSSGV
jgi:hypothetical protein